MSRRDTYERRFDEDVQHTDHNTCPECGGRVTTNARETVCDDCGLVIDEQQLDHGPEWRSFDDDRTNPERTGAPLMEGRHDRGLSTEVGRYRDGNGNVLSEATRKRFARLRRQHSRAQWQSKAERNLGHGCSEIARIVGALGLSRSVREQASSLFRTAQREDLLRGRSIEAMAAASVYAACRCTGLARTLDEVVGVAQVDESSVQNSYHVLNVELGLDAMIQQPTDFVPRLAADCAAPDRVQHRALELAEIAEQTEIANGRQPSGVAAGCLYRAAREYCWSLTQAELADAANTTPVTIRARDEELGDALENGSA